jgi:proline iminopeptidase
MNHRSRITLTLAALGTACQTLSPSDPGNLVPRTVTEDPMLPAIDMNGTRFHLETVGNPANPVIIFLHGGPGGDYRSMLPMAATYNGRSLADDHFLVFWDQRGAGLSARVGSSTLTIARYREDLDSLVNRYSPGRPVTLIGVSWGGMYATDYINNHPSKVAGAVLIEPGPMDGATAERLKDDIAEFDLGAEWLNDAAWSSGFLTPDDHVRMDYDRLLAMKDGQPRYHQSRSHPEIGWRQGAAANKYVIESGQDGSGRFSYDFTTHLSAYRTPVLFIAGSLSEVLGPSLQQQQVHHFPAGTLQVVSGAGHDVAWIKTSEVIAHVRTYIDAQTGGTP